MSEQVVIDPKACGCATQVRMPIVDERCSVLGMCPDLWPSLGVVNVDPDTCMGSVSGQYYRLGGEKHSRTMGGASCMLHHLPLKLLHFHPFHYLTPLCTRICR